MATVLTPGDSVHYRKKIRKDMQAVSLNADMIRLLMVIEEGKSLYQISAEAEMDAPTFKQTLAALLAQGLIEPVQRDAQPLDRSFLNALRSNLTRVVGPMAEILMEEVLAEMGLDAARFPLEQAADIINRVALEIPDEGSRIQFKKSMIPILNKVKT
ncbi:MAG: hypothetical protein MUF46_06995 [Desulfobacterales bacterium]|jgi:DNA-binding MarR family transcriptional regulator|nr:hypothetical protein [Desulfobacterales bacterium]